MDIQYRLTYTYPDGSETSTVFRYYFSAVDVFTTTIAANRIHQLYAKVSMTAEPVAKESAA
jgi:hypothetical protein